jgi:hypothetical protein
MRLSQAGAVLIFTLGGAVIGSFVAIGLRDQFFPGHRLKGDPEELREAAQWFFYSCLTMGAVLGAAVAAFVNWRRRPDR